MDGESRYDALTDAFGDGSAADRNAGFSLVRDWNCICRMTKRTHTVAKIALSSKACHNPDFCLGDGN